MVFEPYKFYIKDLISNFVKMNINEFKEYFGTQLPTYKVIFSHLSYHDSSNNQTIAFDKIIMSFSKLTNNISVISIQHEVYALVEIVFDNNQYFLQRIPSTSSIKGCEIPDYINNEYKPEMTSYIQTIMQELNISQLDSKAKNGLYYTRTRS